MDNEFLLNDRLQKIRQILSKYGIENFYMSYSGGKDSVVLSNLLDMAIPNQIPRVYVNTGIELNAIRDFVIEQSKIDDRIVILQPTQNIKQTLETFGYPFKSKKHSVWVDRYQRKGKITGVKQYLGERPDKKPWGSENSCPKCLKYQFTPDFKIKLSDKCCVKLKEEPLKVYSKKNNKPCSIIGIMRDEGGRRSNSQCLVFRNNELHFQPLAPMTKEWEQWFIDTYNITICAVYNEPYNFKRTGCKGCPFSKNLQHELDILEQYFPNERKQCEYIWKPIYDEYRRIGYRLKMRCKYE